jgi:hypothetical protein
MGCKFLCEAVQSFGFLKAGKGPKLTKKKKLECLTKSEMVIWSRAFRIFANNPRQILRHNLPST